MISLPRDRMDQLVKRFDMLEAQMAAGNDPDAYVKMASEYADLKDMVFKVRELRAAEQELADLEAMLADEGTDAEMRALAQGEVETVGERIEALQKDIQILLLPKDAADARSAILEIRAGTGGDEAALFAGDLYRMYERYAAEQGWRFETVSASEGDVGGFKEVIATVSGKGVFARLKFESGAHRVQRVPETEGGGRIHTSAATVAVMPEVDDVEVHIDERDLDWQFTLSQGAGGQNVQKNQTAVRLTHKPTGMVVTCQDERSQLQNKEKALRMLRARLYEIEMAERNKDIYERRKSQVASGDRSDKIRTYNFQQNRVTDHRTGQSWINELDRILDGDIGDIVEGLRLWDETNRLGEGESA
jgi:peptide chain release factor 1